MRKVILLVIVGVSPLLAQTINSEGEHLVKQINNTFESSRGKGVSVFSNDEYIRCWSETDGDGSGVHGQLFFRNGSKKNEEFIVNTTTKSNQVGPCVSTFKDNGFVVCWMSAWQDGSGHGIYAQLFGSNGKKRGPEFQVNTLTNGDQWDPCVCTLNDGSFVVCWSGAGVDKKGYRVQSQLYDANGKKSGKEFQVNTYSYGNQFVTDVSVLKNGNFIVCWTSDSQDGSDRGIYGQILDENAKKIGKEFQINTFTDNDQITPNIASLSNGGFFVCWASFSQNGNVSGIVGQLFDENGGKVGNELSLGDKKYEHYLYPRITSFKNGDFAVCWNKSCKVFNSFGIEKGPAFQSITLPFDRVLDLCINSFNDGGFIISWFGEAYKYLHDNPLPKGLYARNYENEIIHALQPFEIINPDYDDVIKINDPVFSWRKASQSEINLPYELKYDLYISKNANYKNLMIVKDIYDTTYQVTGLEKGATYFWHVCAKNIAGDSLWSSNTNAFFVDHNATTGVEEKQEIPEGLSLHANYPNPFNPSTTINYELPTSGSISLKIFDIIGRLVTELLNTTQQAGAHAITWNSCDQSGSLVAAGVYIYQLQFTDANGKTTILHKKMSLVK